MSIRNTQNVLAALACSNIHCSNIILFGERNGPLRFVRRAWRPWIKKKNNNTNTKNKKQRVGKLLAIFKKIIP